MESTEPDDNPSSTVIWSNWSRCCPFTIHTLDMNSISNKSFAGVLSVILQQFNLTGFNQYKLKLLKIIHPFIYKRSTVFLMIDCFEGYDLWVVSSSLTGRQKVNRNIGFFIFTAKDLFLCKKTAPTLTVIIWGPLPNAYFYLQWEQG